MLKKIMSFVLLFTLVFSVGCGSGGLSNKDLAGNYKLVELVSDDEGDLTESLDTLADLGITFELELNEDGTGKMLLAGEGIDLTFDAAEKTITMYGQNVTFEYKNKKITFEEEGTRMSFEKQ